MIPDPTDEIKTVRHRLGAELDFDLHRIVADTRRRQEDSGRQYIRLPKRPSRKTNGSIGPAAGAVPEINVG
jgi:hypothetical protein